MADQDLRGLERAARDAPEDLGVWVRYVTALDASGQPPPADLAEVAARYRACPADARELARIQVGDEVWVEEHDTPWIAGRWRGIVTSADVIDVDTTGKPYLRFRVRPSADDADELEALPWRVRVLPEQRVRGLELGRDDRLEVVARAVDPGPFPK